MLIFATFFSSKNYNKMARYAGSKIRNARLTKEILQIEKGKSLHGKFNFHFKS